MVFYQKSIDQILRRQHCIDFVEMKLTQNKVDNPRQYLGPGSVYFDKNGNLLLKMYCEINDVVDELNSVFNPQHSDAGTIISSEMFYSLRAIDMNGNIWISKNISIDLKFNLPLAGKVIKAKINRLYAKTFFENINSNKKFTTIYFDHKIKIPLNEIEKFINGGWKLNKSKFDILKNNVEIFVEENYSKIFITSDILSNGNNIEKKFLEALGILIGENNVPVITIFRKKNLSIEIVNSIVNITKYKLDSPIPISKDYQLDAFLEFLEKYINRIKKDNSSIYGYWLDIHNAMQSGLLNIALPLSIAIEGIAKEYFISFGSPDEEFKFASEKAREKVNSLDIDDKVRDRLNQSLNLANSFNIKTCLFNLAEQGILSKKLVKDWVKLRNKSAHPNKSVEFKGQKDIDLIYSSYELFYRLIFNIVDYKGDMYCFSKRGWPIEKVEKIRKKK